MPIQFRGQSTVSAERRDSPHTASVHSSESKIFGPIFGQLTRLLYLEPFFLGQQPRELGKARSGLVRWGHARTVPERPAPGSCSSLLLALSEA